MNRFFINYLKEIIPVQFCLKEGNDIINVGNGEPAFTVILNRPLERTSLMTSTSLALGEAYMHKDIDLDRDLYEVINLFLGQINKFTTNKFALKKLYRSSASKRSQKKEVSSHYDIGNDFYSLWLDETMSYSCGYFKTDTDTLYNAQVNKVHHILNKLQLKEGMSLLDIGCGWGFLLLEAARKYKIKGTGITLSQEQYNKFKERIKEEHLENYLTVHLMDYRDLFNSGMQFDRVVSVGMLEHVGRKNYNLFIQNVNSVLKPQGLFLLHYISALRENPGDAWIRKYIFPGGTIPSLREIVSILPDYNFYTLDIESLRRHYTKTLLCWRKNFLQHKDEILDMKGEEFTRMWDLYLASCASTFNNGIVDLHQILISKDVNNEIPMLRCV